MEATSQHIVNVPSGACPKYLHCGKPMAQADEHGRRFVCTCEGPQTVSLDDQPPIRHRYPMGSLEEMDDVLD